MLTSNSSAAVGGGSSQVIFTTPSGANIFKGSLYWSNRNKTFAANEWFNNRDGIARPAYNQNQGGGYLGGRIIKDKLFFYANYEAFRLHRQSTANRTILTSDARNGIFTYRDTSGRVQKVNVLQAMGFQMNSTITSLLQKVPGADKINNFRNGDSSESLLRNTGGYSYTLRYNRIRDNVTGKVDFVNSVKHVFSGMFAWNRDYLDRPDATYNYDTVPPVFNDNKTKFFSATWRWNPSPAITNELRGGINLAPGVFKTSYEPGAYRIQSLLFTNPENFTTTPLPQGRYTNTYSLQDNANYVRGRHSFQLGFQMQKVRVESFNDPYDIVPTYTIGLGTGNQGLTADKLPGISASDLSNANSLLASLSGYVYQSSQTFNVTSRTSGFVSGANNMRHFTQGYYALYFQDNWKMSKKLSLNLGLRYDYYPPVDERDALYLLPQVGSGSFIDALLSNSTLDFAGNSVGRSYYNPDKNNFAPVVGLAYDVFGDGKTAIRASYSLSYVNDESIRTVENNVGTNNGLSANATKTGLKGITLANLSGVTTPAYKVPRTFADNYAMNTQSAYGMPDPGLRTPYIQQWTFGIQQAVKGAVVEVRYVGNHATKLWRAFDYNQVIIKNNGFLDDFKRAYNNGLLAQKATGRFLPAYDPSISGSQPLPVFNQLASPLLTNATIITYIQQQQVGELANTYQTNGLAGNVKFYQNAYGLGCNSINNYSNASYNALQIDVRKQTRVGLYLQGNYAWSKNLSDQDGIQQTRFEAFLDVANPSIERAPTSFDLRHQFKVNWKYDLPMGKGHKLSYGPLDRVLGGWYISGIYTWQSGNPFSVLSGRGTLNRSGRSGSNTATALVTADKLDEMFQVRMTGVGPYYFAVSGINPSDNRAVAADGVDPFSGQVFRQPNAGEVGALQRRMFSGPSVYNLDFSAGKLTSITESQSIEFRMDSTNIFNHPTWYVGDQTITSTTFGRITSPMFDRRLIQFGLTYRF